MSQIDDAPVESSGSLPAPPGLTIEDPGTDGTEGVVLSFPVPDASSHASRLTNAERAVAQGILHGLTYRELAERRGVSARTVSNQVRAVFAKLRVHSRLDLALLLRHEASF